MPLGARMAAVMDGQAGYLMPWTPVCLGLGVGVYFALRVEPGQGAWIALAGLACLAVFALRYTRYIPLGFLLVLAGFALAAYRTHSVAAPVLDFRYYGPIEGRIVVIDRSRSDKPRLTLDQVVLHRVAPEKTPVRVRVSLHGQQGFIEPEPGMRVILTGHLGAPEGPVEPGGFDFQRQAWFQRLGAVGYTRTPALAFAPAEQGKAGLFVHRMRAAISAYVQEALPGRTGAFAAAITTGDRSAMDEPTLEALRVSNLAHLLAISGLHMGMLTGFIYALTRYGLALWPRAALNWPLHRIGAVVALISGAFYLALSGGNVATERAFIMVAVMLLAIMVDRRALTIRSVAFAATVILVFRPEVMTGPGFQMSFAATTALIWVFANIRDAGIGRWSPAGRWFLALVVSSAVAGLATAPIAAAHFNRVPHYGLIANILSVPVMGGIVMPAAVLSAVLAPFGLSWVGLKLMAPGIDWILRIAEWVAGFDGAVSHVPAPQGFVLPLLVLGALWVVLWQGRARWVGVVPVLVALVAWAGVSRPHLLISADGSLLGLMTEEGRALSKPKGQGFSARSWLENDGDPAEQDIAALRAGFSGPQGALGFELQGRTVLHFSGRGAVERSRGACSEAEIVIIAAKADQDAECLLFDRSTLARTGAVAIYAEDAALRIVQVKDRIRPWSGAGLPADQ